MSSPKDYVLEISPSVEGKSVHSSNLIKFTVRHRQDILSKSRLPLLFTIFGILFGLFGQVFTVDSILNFDLQVFKRMSTTQAIGLFVLISLAIVLLSKQSPEDSVIIMKDIGVQTISKKGWRFQNTVEVFIPLTDIIDLVIHEAFHNYGQVIFYLCVLTKPNSVSKSSNDNIIKVVFPEFLPRKDILLQVWKLSRDLLFGETRRYWRRVPGQGLKQI